ncbi:hypothetical protein PS854_05649 [Pseudomonas fluorescens]|uniref:Uncharacterized protein n=1 Tax=Pseudomonas fluorescens TaxID=294 RepID=A0A5E7Q1L0_PSEFL|nr:hypothetical protein PS854_05649 [Pseudomonas fluorescens]
MFDRATVRRVTRAQAAIGIDHELRHQEQRNAFRTGRCVRQFGQHQVNDVFGQVVLATGDEDLGAADLVGTVGLRLGLGADDAQIGAGVRFGQAHGTGPDTGVHVRQVRGFQFFAGVGVDRQAGAGGQHRVQTERQAGRVDHFFDLGRYGFGHAHAAVGRIATDADPAAFSISLISLWETGRCGDGTVRPVAAFFVSRTAQGRDAFASDLASFLENGFDGFRINGLCQSRQFGPEFGDLENFVENEAHIAQGRFVIGHGKPRKI